ncbi:hypothetical protein H310_12419 [Aphanomyces invadans]|uniref:Secreted protein n=1 Tax=Aphanomyces invadans TaxID=157072 RepID=A0A024TI23_9STRA|nr:hypothetical protein H310_12419 [Aphanomyces invadans]ETV93649.1 hypothetical protein H310_12419 [Aphanomyces invadans]|eukprot:XP_008877690.1 hypothetical protein H310_12419 [Aphanomyces invadans]
MRPRMRGTKWLFCTCVHHTLSFGTHTAILPIDTHTHYKFNLQCPHSRLLHRAAVHHAMPTTSIAPKLLAGRVGPIHRSSLVTFRIIIRKCLLIGAFRTLNPVTLAYEFEV